MGKFITLLFLLVLPVLLADKVLVPKDVCTFSCVQRLYKNYCGGAECVHGAKTEEQKEAMCSDSCLDALFGQPLIKCLKKGLPTGADTYDFQNFLMEKISDFCFPEPAMGSEMSQEVIDEDLELQDSDK